MWQGIKDWFKGPDGNADEMAALAIIGFMTFLGLAIYAYGWKAQPFDPIAFGTGMALALGATATGMGIKAKFENNGGH